MKPAHKKAPAVRQHPEAKTETTKISMQDTSIGPSSAQNCVDVLGNNPCTQIRRFLEEFSSKPLLLMDKAMYAFMTAQNCAITKRHGSFNRAEERSKFNLGRQYDGSISEGKPNQSLDLVDKPVVVNVDAEKGLRLMQTPETFERKCSKIGSKHRPENFRSVKHSLTTARRCGSVASATAQSVAGFDSPVMERRRAANKAFGGFFRISVCSMSGPDGEPQGSPVLHRSVNLSGPLTLFDGKASGSSTELEHTL